MVLVVLVRLFRPSAIVLSTTKRMSQAHTLSCHFVVFISLLISSFWAKAVIAGVVPSPPRVFVFFRAEDSAFPTLVHFHRCLVKYGTDCARVLRRPHDGTQ